MFRQLARPQVQLQILLVLAVALGGGGIVYGWRHMGIELFALLVLALNTPKVLEFLGGAPIGIRLVSITTLMLPLLQAIPLPPSIWQALPGRELVSQAYAVTGIAPDSWFPFALDPMRSLVAFCAALVPFTVIAIGWTLDQRERINLAWTLCICAGAGLLLGIVQLASANTLGMLQPIRPDVGVLYATFSNRNSTGMFFVLVALLVLALPWPRTVPGLATCGIATSLALLAIFLSQSRSSITVSSLVLVFAGLRLMREWRTAKRGHQGSSRIAGYAAPMAAALIVAAFAFTAVLSVTMEGRLASAAQRFYQIDGDRLEMWDDSAYLAGRYWPVGAGTGAFDDAFQIDESLEYVSPAKAGRAHNDYLELAVELGIPGMLVLAAWWSWIGLAAWRRSRDPDRMLAWAAFLGFMAIALQSMLDYPLRNHALLAVAGVLVVFLLPARPPERREVQP